MTTEVNELNDILHPLRRAHHAQRSNDHSCQQHGICTGTPRSIHERCSFARRKREFNNANKHREHKMHCASATATHEKLKLTYTFAMAEGDSVLLLCFMYLFVEFMITMYD